MQIFSDLSRRRWPAALVLAVFFLQGLFLIRATSPTTDEIPFHTVNGYTYLVTRDYRMNPSSPALVREWMALPWLWMRPKLDLSKLEWEKAESHPFGVSFFYQDNQPILEHLLFASRFMILLLGLALGWTIYIFSKSLYGAAGGLISLAFFALCPAFIGHSAIATTDIGAALCATLAAYRCWRLLEDLSTKNSILFSLTLGLAFAAKSSTLLFGPVFLALVATRHGFRVFIRTAALAAVLSFLVVWASYFFEFKPLLASGVPRVEEKLGYIASTARLLFPGNHALEAFLRKAALEMPIPIPTYLLSIGGVLRQHSSPFMHYFMEWSTDRHWQLYLVLFSVKMTIPFLIVLITRLVWELRRRTLFAAPNHILLLPAAIFMAALALETGANGIRYFFPAMPLLFVWAGGAAAWSKNPYGKYFITALIAANVFVTTAVYPDYLSYFNRFIGGAKNAPYYFRDSDVDWGQGLKQLKEYSDKNRLGKIKLRYFGTAQPAFYGIESEPLTEEDRKTPAPAVYAISANYLDDLSWWKSKKPSVVLGGIFIYDLRA